LIFPSFARFFFLNSFSRAFGEGGREEVPLASPPLLYYFAYPFFGSGKLVRSSLQVDFRKFSILVPFFPGIFFKLDGALLMYGRWILFRFLYFFFLNHGWF